MLLLSACAAVGASSGWAVGIVLAQGPARMIGAFEFTRIQLVACAAIFGTLCTLLGYWQSVAWSYWPSYAVSTVVGIILANLAMIECLRRGGPRRTELLLSLKAPLVGAMAFVWLGETPSAMDLAGAGIGLSGVGLAIAYGSNESSQSDAVSGRLWIVAALGIASAVCQGFGYLVLKPAMQSGTEPLAITAIRLLGAALLISVAALWPTGIFRSKSEITPYLLGRTILPGFIGYGISSSLLLYAFANFDAAVAAVLGSLSPVLVLPILWGKEGKRPRLPAIAGALLAVLGTSIIVLL